MKKPMDGDTRLDEASLGQLLRFASAKWQSECRKLNSLETMLTICATGIRKKDMSGLERLLPMIEEELKGSA